MGLPLSVKETSPDSSVKLPRINRQAGTALGAESTTVTQDDINTADKYYESVRRPTTVARNSTKENSSAGESRASHNETSTVKPENEKSTFERFCNFIGDTCKSIGNGLVSGTKAVLGAHLYMLNLGVDIIKFAGQMIWQMGCGIVDMIKKPFTAEFWKDVGNALKEFGTKLIKDPLGALWDVCKGVGKFVWDSVAMPFQTIALGIQLIASGRIAEGICMIGLGVACVALLATGVYAVAIGPILGSLVLKAALSRGIQGVVQVGLRTIAKDIGVRVAAACVEQAGISKLRTAGKELATNVGSSLRKMASEQIAAGATKDIVEKNLVQAAYDKVKAESKKQVEAILKQEGDFQLKGNNLCSQTYNYLKDVKRSGVNPSKQDFLRCQIEDETMGSLYQLSSGPKIKRDGLKFKKTSAADYIEGAQDRLITGGQPLGQIATKEELAVAASDARALMKNRSGFRAYLESGMDSPSARLFNSFNEKVRHKSVSGGKVADEFDQEFKKILEDDITDQLVEAHFQEMWKEAQPALRSELEDIKKIHGLSDNYVDDSLIRAERGMKDGLDETFRPMVKDAVETGFLKFRRIIPKADFDMLRDVASLDELKLGALRLKPASTFDPDDTGNRGDGGGNRGRDRDNRKVDSEEDAGNPEPKSKKGIFGYLSWLVRHTSWYGKDDKYDWS